MTTNSLRLSRFVLSMVLSIISIVAVNAQKQSDAEALINRVVAKLNKNAVRANFELFTTEKNGVNSQSVSGTFIMKAAKFYLNMGETKVWFDGKTQWTVMENERELSITEPDAVEIASINPLAVIAGFKAKSTISFSRKKSNQFYIIDLKPKTKTNGFSGIEVYLNKSNETIAKLIISDTKLKKTTLQLSKLEQNISVADNQFICNKSNYKSYLINDLR